MSTFGQDLIESLGEALAFSKGAAADSVRVHHIHFPDVRALREDLGLSQQAFAMAYHNPLATL